MILFLEPYFEKKPWAGDKLKTIYDCPDGTGEAWIVSGYIKKSSKVKYGRYKGQTLRHLWRKHPELFGNYSDKEFPLLIKIIDAKEDLSVQVHPNDNYALEYHNSLGKFECWYFLNQNEAKSCIAGIDAKKRLDVSEYIKYNILPEKLIRRNVNNGDLVVIEPGTVHALQAGSLVLEVQESSDITYRLYDYNRGRELHIDDSLNVITYNDLKNPVHPFQSAESYDSKYFTIRKIFLTGNEVYKCNSFAICYIIDGTAVVNGTTVNKGDTFILTQGETEIKCSGIGSALVVIPKEKEETRAKMRKVALITGISSQDGSYLTEFLLDKGYEVHGLINSKNLMHNEYLRHLTTNDEIFDKYLFLHLGDMTDSSNINRIIENVHPDEIYHLASQSHIDLSFEMPEYTADVNAIGTLRLLDAIKQSEIRTKLFNESTCHLFSGKKETVPQDENTPFEPMNPYATSKLYSHCIVRNYRDAYGIFAVNGIMFTHSSPREDYTFVGRKITKTVADIIHGKNKVLEIGNLYAKRDWGYAKDYVEGMWLSLQSDTPTDYVFASGETHTIKEFVELAFKVGGIEIEWRGEGLDEKGYNKKDGKILVEVSPKYYRVLETFYLKGNPTKAQTVLNWKNKTSFMDLVRTMVLCDLSRNDLN